MIVTWFLFWEGGVGIRGVWEVSFRLVFVVLFVFRLFFYCSGYRLSSIKGRFEEFCVRSILLEIGMCVFIRRFFLFLGMLSRMLMMSTVCFRFSFAVYSFIT